METLSFFDTFHFLRPWWLLLLPVWAFITHAVWTNRQQQSGWSALCDPALLNYLTGDAAPQKTTSKVWLATIILAGITTIVALAGPVWKQLPQPVFQTQSGMIILLDLSRSMDAEDVKPSRLIRAKQKIHDMLAIRQEGQTGLIVFAGSAFDVVPMTTDNQAILSLLSSLDTSMMPAQGSMASQGLKHAMAMLQRGAIHQGSVVMLCDGVDQAAVTAARQLADAGHIVSVLAVGSVDGAPIPARSDRSDKIMGGFMKDDLGHIILPRLDERHLAAVAAAGDGIFQHIRLDDLDVQRIPGLMPSRFANMQDHAKPTDNMQTDQWHEAGSWLLLGLLPLCALAFRRGVLLLLLMIPMLSPTPSQAMTWDDWWQTADQQAKALMMQNKHKEAAALFNDPQWQAAAHYRAEQFDASAQALADIEATEALYNKGNALARSGDPQAALEAYNQTLQQNASHSDALFNRNLIAQIQQQQEKKKGESDQGKSDKGENQQSDQQNDSSQDSSETSEPSESSQSSPQRSDPSKQSDASQQQQADQNPAEDEQQSTAQKADAEQIDDKQTDDEQTETKQTEEKTSAQEKLTDKQTAQSRSDDQASMEKQQAIQQWLRRIPDDPGGLMRRKFKYQYQQQQGQTGSQQAW